MDISAFVIPAIVVVALLAAIAAGYYLLYSRMINKALDGKGRKRIRLAPPYKVLISLLFFVVVLLGAIYLPKLGRVATAKDIEEDLRKFTVNGDQTVEVAMAERMAVVIAYDEQTAHTYVYRNDNKTFPNYVFRYGGHLTSTDRSATVYRMDGMLAFASMNAPHIAKIVCHDGDTYEINPNHPFVLILPSGGFDVYDEEGNLIDLERDWWYEVIPIN